MIPIIMMMMIMRVMTIMVMIKIKMAVNWTIFKLGASDFAR